jgi:ABC-type glycerol-3-phosphate transport system substrate-binding protein
MSPVRAVSLAAVLILMAPFGAKSADLVVWWDQGAYAQEDEALKEIVAAFEQKTGKRVELTLYSLDQLPDKIVAALESGRPPDFAYGMWLNTYIPRWALEDRLVDLMDTVGSFSSMFDPAQLNRATLRDAKTGQRALYGLPIGQIMNHIHVWKSLLLQAGVSHSKTSPRSGMRSGRSGATGCSRRCARPRAATTSGVSAWPCRSRPMTARTSSSSSSTPTMRTT